jgi:excisionase family DNA binding protein
MDTRTATPMSDLPNNDKIGDESRPRLLSVKRALFELGIGRTLFYELLDAGTIVSVKIGRRRFVPCEAIDRFIESLLAVEGSK